MDYPLGRVVVGNSKFVIEERLELFCLLQVYRTKTDKIYEYSLLCCKEKPRPKNNTQDKPGAAQIGAQKYQKDFKMSKYW